MLCSAAATNGPARRQSTLHCIAVFEGRSAHVTRASRLLTSTPAGGGLYLHSTSVEDYKALSLLGVYTPGSSVMLMAMASLYCSAPCTEAQGELRSPQPETSWPVGATCTSAGWALMLASFADEMMNKSRSRGQG